MEKITLISQNTAKKNLKSGVLSWLHSENTLFSLIGSEPISNLQMLLIVHSVLAFFILIACCHMGIVTAGIGLAWFALSLYSCSRSGIR